MKPIQAESLGPARLFNPRDLARATSYARGMMLRGATDEEVVRKTGLTPASIKTLRKGWGVKPRAVV